MMIGAMSLPPFVQAVKEFQQLGLVNKAVIDVLAVDVPLVTLAKNQTERKERLLRQALVLLIAFMIAPLHAKSISALFSRRLGFALPGLNEKLMQVSFKNLWHVSQLKQGLENLFRHELKEAMPSIIKQNLHEGLRRKLVAAKTHFLMADLAVCGLLLSSVGFIKVMFGRFLSGKHQFSGEFGIVSEKTLDRLYEKEQRTKKQYLTRYWKEAMTFGISILTPILFGLLFRRALWKPDANGLLKSFTQKLAPILDYNYPRYVKRLKGWPLLSDGAQIMLSLLLTIGELASARSRREFKELAIQRNSIDAMFFFGTPAFMKLFSGSTTIQGALNQIRSKNPQILQNAARRSALTYIASFTLASLSVAGIVSITNQMTRKAVKEDAAKLDVPTQPKPFALPSPVIPSTALNTSLPVQSALPLYGPYPAYAYRHP